MRGKMVVIMVWSEKLSLSKRNRSARRARDGKCPRTVDGALQLRYCSCVLPCSQQILRLFHGYLLYCSTQPSSHTPHITLHHLATSTQVPVRLKSAAHPRMCRLNIYTSRTNATANAMKYHLAAHAIQAA